MIGYGMAKAAVHQLVASLSQPDAGLPVDATVLAILPYVDLMFVCVPFVSYVPQSWSEFTSHTSLPIRAR